MEFVGDFDDSRANLISSCGAWIGEEVLGSCIAGEGGCCAEGEDILVEFGEGDVRVVVDPCESFLYAFDFEFDEAVEDAHDRLVQDRSAKGLIQGCDHLVGESDECVVHCCGGGIDPAEDIVVDLSICGVDYTVCVCSPGCGSSVERGDNFVGKVLYFVDQGRNFLLNSFEK